MQQINHVTPVGNVNVHPLQREEPSLSLLRESDSTSFERVNPAQIFLPSNPTMHELKNILAATRDGIALAGTAAMGQLGRVVGDVHWRVQ